MIFLWSIGALPYAVFSVRLIRHWKRLSFPDLKIKTEFSVIIAFRNEEQNLPNLFRAIEKLNYPKEGCEFIFVNDHSEDNSESLVQEFCKRTNNTLLLKNNKDEHGKNAAIKMGVSKAKCDWLVFTDADIEPETAWLNSLSKLTKEKNQGMIMAPVSLKGTKGFLGWIQKIEFDSLQLATQAFAINERPIMCNGANMAMRKDLFQEAISEYSNLPVSGLDMLLLLYAKKKGISISCINETEAKVYTKPEETIRAFIQQRIRWASKNNILKVDRDILSTGLAVFFMNLSMFVAVFFSWKAYLLLLSIKSVFDYVGLFKYREGKKLISLFAGVILINLIYPIYSLGIGFAALFKSYTWKNRQIKNRIH
jgi:cellulose synthase/poly-beta-1,6-N-acetylglucosamine synthase-like glycosyltransferase